MKVQPIVRILFECEHDDGFDPGRIYSSLKPVLQHPAVVIEAMLGAKLEPSNYRFETVFTVQNIHRAEDSISPRFVVGGFGVLVVQFVRLASLERPIKASMNIRWPLGRGYKARTIGQLDKKLQTLIARMKPRLVADAKREQKRNQRDPDRVLNNAIKRGDSAFDDLER